MRDIAVTNMRRHSSSKKHPWDEAPRAGHLQGTPTHHSQAELQAPGHTHPSQPSRAAGSRAHPPITAKQSCRLQGTPTHHCQAELQAPGHTHPSQPSRAAGWLQEAHLPTAAPPAWRSPSLGGKNPTRSSSLCHS
uniref:Uncharacterized protein n=1 Tax=Mus musculus TaxID=10090 RepID=Q3UR07_MOUSE|nr:unnamed protein product [Mus musculus]BAE43378.1 unnamed protein product [Mus musculus]